MLEVSTTATFDKLFKKLSKSIQRKAATKTDLFRELKKPVVLSSTHTALRVNLRCGGSKQQREPGKRLDLLEL